MDYSLRYLDLVHRGYVMPFPIAFSRGFCPLPPPSPKPLLHQGISEASNTDDSVLVCLTIASFYPQWRRLYRQRDSDLTGVSRASIILNLVAATHHFYFMLFIYYLSNASVMKHYIPSLGQPRVVPAPEDWLNICQVAAFFFCQLVLSVVLLTAHALGSCQWWLTKSSP